MRKRQQQELERLEAALLELEDDEEVFEAEPEVWEEPWQVSSLPDYEMYNTDDADVDLDDYSEEVYQETSGRGSSIFLTMLAMVALSACILLLLKFLEVL